jgi:dihydropteroate synthase
MLKTENEPKNTIFVANTTLNCKGKLVNLTKAQVMGIVNVSPDSFYSGSRAQNLAAILRQTEAHINAGATFIDVGGMSSRPGAEIISIAEEIRRVIPAITQIRARFPAVLLSIDTVHSKVAREAVGAGACMVNDISAGSLDADLFATVAELGVPYVLMHMQGKPKNMQDKPTYTDIIPELLQFFAHKIKALQAAGVHDIIVDPGFGFGKSLVQNHEILHQLDSFSMLERPLLVGISRKSMVYKALGVNPEKALNGTTALHTIALLKGAKILRVHDVQEAVEVIKLLEVVGG